MIMMIVPIHGREVIHCKEIDSDVEVEYTVQGSDTLEDLKTTIYEAKVLNDGHTLDSIEIEVFRIEKYLEDAVNKTARQLAS